MANPLILCVLAPLLFAAITWAWSDEDAASARWIALASSLLVLALAGWLVFNYSESLHAFESTWLGADWQGIDIRFSLGLDGLSIWLFGLSALLTVTAVLVSWNAIVERPGAFYALLLCLETGMLGVFAARDIILFYLFFEFTLVPLFFLIGIWGSERRRYAAVKFFLFTFAGSVLTFLGLLAIVFWDQAHAGRGTLTFSIPTLTAHLATAAGRIDPALQFWIFAALFAGFAIKVPLVPLHTWLPLAHVEAPTAGSVLLAGVLLKVGAYGFLRFSLPLLPDATAAAMPWLLWLSVIGIVYGALVALAQTDIKRLIAYSSVSHLGFCMLGAFALNHLGLEGSVLQMVNHGLSTGALFALVGMLYERYHTRQIRDLSGIARRTPRLAALMLLMTLSSIGVPGLNGFAGELLVLLGMFQRAWTAAPAGYDWQFKTIAVLSVSGVLLGAWYMLWLVERVFFGPLKEPAKAREPIADLSFREVLALAPLAALAFWIGLAPGFFLDRIRPAVADLAAPPAIALASRSAPVRAPGPALRRPVDMAPAEAAKTGNASAPVNTSAPAKARAAARAGASARLVASESEAAHAP